jgi:hypothetical protein
VVMRHNDTKTDDAIGRLNDCIGRGVKPLRSCGLWRKLTAHLTLAESERFCPKRARARPIVVEWHWQADTAA